MNRNVLFVAAMILVYMGAFYLYGLMAFSDMPDVHVSYSTKECVAVINYGDTEYTCDNYPKKYNHIWVQ